MIRQLVAGLLFDSINAVMEHGEHYELNLLADNDSNEVFYFADLVKFTIEDLTTMREGYPIMLLFLKKTELDNNAAQQDATVEAMRGKVRSFIAHCRDAKQQVQSITNIESVEIRNLFDANYSGWMLYCKIQPVNSGAIC